MPNLNSFQDGYTTLINLWLNPPKEVDTYLLENIKKALELPNTTSEIAFKRQKHRIQLILNDWAYLTKKIRWQNKDKIVPIMKFFFEYIVEGKKTANHPHLTSPIKGEGKTESPSRGEEYKETLSRGDVVNALFVHDSIGILNPILIEDAKAKENEENLFELRARRNSVKIECSGEAAVKAISLYLYNKTTRNIPVYGRTAIDNDSIFDDESAGLAFFSGIFAKLLELKLPVYSAFSGRIDKQNIEKVGGFEGKYDKFDAAYDNGIKELFIPADIELEKEYYTSIKKDKYCIYSLKETEDLSDREIYEMKVYFVSNIKQFIDYSFKRWYSEDILERKIKQLEEKSIKNGIGIKYEDIYTKAKEITKVYINKSDYDNNNYQKRALEDSLEEFLDDKNTNVFLLLGESGMGKSTMLKSLALKWLNDNKIVLFLNAEGATGSFYEHLITQIPEQLCIYKDIDYILNILQDKLFIVILDQLDNARKPLDYLQNINNLIVSLNHKYPNFKIITAFRTAIYKKKKEDLKFQNTPLVINPEFFWQLHSPYMGVIEIELKEFDPYKEDIENLYNAYYPNHILFKQLSKEIQETIRLPWILKTAVQAKIQPENINGKKVLEEFIKQKISPQRSNFINTLVQIIFETNEYPVSINKLKNNKTLRDNLDNKEDTRCVYTQLIDEGVLKEEISDSVIFIRFYWDKIFQYFIGRYLISLIHSKGEPFDKAYKELLVQKNNASVKPEGFNDIIWEGLVFAISEENFDTIKTLFFFAVKNRHDQIANTLFGILREVFTYLKQNNKEYLKNLINKLWANNKFYRDILSLTYYSELFYPQIFIKAIKHRNTLLKKIGINYFYLMFMNCLQNNIENAFLMLDMLFNDLHKNLKVSHLISLVQNFKICLNITFKIIPNLYQPQETMEYLFYDNERIKVIRNRVMSYMFDKWKYVISSPLFTFLLNLGIFFYPLLLFAHNIMKTAGVKYKDFHNSVFKISCEELQELEICIDLIKNPSSDKVKNYKSLFIKFSHQPFSIGRSLMHLFFLLYGVNYFDEMEEIYREVFKNNPLGADLVRASLLRVMQNTNSIDIIHKTGKLLEELEMWFFENHIEEFISLEKYKQKATMYHPLKPVGIYQCKTMNKVDKIPFIINIFQKTDAFNNAELRRKIIKRCIEDTTGIGMYYPKYALETLAEFILTIKDEEIMNILAHCVFQISFSYQKEVNDFIYEKRNLFPVIFLERLKKLEEKGELLIKVHQYIDERGIGKFAGTILLEYPDLKNWLMDLVKKIFEYKNILSYARYALPKILKKIKLLN